MRRLLQKRSIEGVDAAVRNHCRNRLNECPVHLFTDWLSAWTTFLLTFLFVGLGALEIRQTRNQKSTAKKHQQPTHHHQQPAGQTHSTAKQIHPTEEEHRSAEQAYWERHLETRNRVDWIGWVALAFSAFAAVGVILSFYETWRQADIAQATLIQSSRAWINVNVDPGSMALTWDKAELPTVKVLLKGTNEGNSPAIDVQVFPVLFSPQGGKAMAIRARTKLLCSGWTMLGNIVFIKDDIIQAWANTLDDGSVQKWVHRVKQHAPPSQPIPVPLSLAVCAAYKIVGDDLTHHTARIYDIGRVFPTGSLIPLLGESMTADHISLTREYEGEYAD